MDTVVAYPSIVSGLTLGLGVWLFTYAMNRAWCAFWRIMS